MNKDLPAGVVKCFVLKNGLSINGAVCDNDSIMVTIVKLNGDIMSITYDTIQEVKTCRVSKELRSSVEKYAKYLYKINEMKRESSDLRCKIRDLYIKDFWDNK